MYTNSKEFLKILDVVKVHSVFLQGLSCQGSRKTEVLTRGMDEKNSAVSRLFLCALSGIYAGWHLFKTGCLSVVRAG